MAKYAQYGDKKMELGDLSLDKAKEIVARFFPELAEPKIETKKDGENTIYVFSKQAGRKGSDAQFTPGPWRVVAAQEYYIESDCVFTHHKYESGLNVPTAICPKQSQFIAEVSNGPDDFGQANARLIAAAPDLFNACVLLEQFAKRVLDYTERNPKNLLYGDELVRQSRAILSALSKVRGEME